jgi:NAD(P)-binding Rossmann-like domain
MLAMSVPPIKFHVAIWFVFLCDFLLLWVFDGSLLLISGGGIGGLTLAFALSKSPDISVDVYEAASKFTEIGAGITLWWRTRQVLKSLGLEEDVIRLLTVPPGQDRGELGSRWRS